MKTDRKAAITNCLLAAGMFLCVSAKGTPDANPKEANGGAFVEASGIDCLRDFSNKRASSWDRTGGNCDWILIPPHQKKIIFEEKNSGRIRHFYWTYVINDEKTQLNNFRGLVLRAFWDNESVPSIEVPLGDFFGVSNGKLRTINSLMFCTYAGYNRKANHSWGFNCYLPMPFSNGARIEIENQGDVEANYLYFHFDYESYADGQAVTENTGRLHAQWNREESPEKASDGKGKNNYTILDIAGDGQFAGYFFTAVNKGGWWGEGDDMVFIDGESYPPSIHGTGTEEIFGGGASPVTEYSTPYTGFHCIENRAGYDWWGTTGMYRFYMADPIRFRKSIRVTLEHGHGNDKANDYSSVAFWYQRGINRGLASLPPLEKRQINFQ